MGSYVIICALVVAAAQIYEVQSQLPPRLAIPGALLVSTPVRSRQRIQQEPNPLPRLRKPQFQPAFQAPVREQVRPVIEEPEEHETQRPSILDDEVSKLSISALQSAVGQGFSNEQEQEPPRPVQFRPERPLPILRENVRENIPRPLPIDRPLPSLRQEQPRQVVRQNIPIARPVVRQEPIARPAPPRQAVRNDYRDDYEEENIPVRRPSQATRQRVAQAPRQQAPQYLDDGTRAKKPPVQILRKFRNDNEDGSITWGYENEDGTFKEETLGADCITRGKYGYVDPDGVKREFSYETGSKCDPEEELLDEELLPQLVNKGVQKRPVNFPARY